MPNYHYYCETCDEDTELWRSITSDPLTTGECGHDIVQVIDRVNTMGVGAHGQKTVEVEAREARWAKDMPAYARFRKKGYMPPQIDGCDKLEATAQNYVEVNTGGRIKVDEQRMQEAKVLADDIMAGRA